MAKYMFSTIFVSCVIILAACKKLPSTLKRCHVDEKLNACLADAIQDALPSLKTGIPELGVLPSDPLTIAALKIEAGNNGGTLRQYYTNTLCTGAVSGVKVLRVETFLDKDSMKMVLNVLAPKIQLLGDYDFEGTLTGKVLKGKGKYSWNFENVNATFVFYGKSILKDGESYMSIDNLDLNYTPDKAILNLDNIFDGNKQLSDEFNQHLSTNWQMVHQEIQPGFTQALRNIYKVLANKFFLNVPYNEIFIYA